MPQKLFLNVTQFGWMVQLLTYYKFGADMFLLFHTTSAKHLEKNNSMLQQGFLLHQQLLSYYPYFMNGNGNSNNWNIKQLLFYIHGNVIKINR